MYVHIYIYVYWIHMHDLLPFRRPRDSFTDKIADGRFQHIDEMSSVLGRLVNRVKAPRAIPGGTVVLEGFAISKDGLTSLSSCSIRSLRTFHVITAGSDWSLSLHFNLAYCHLE